MKMIRGSDGNLDYALLARQGNLVLSVKPNILASGTKMNVPGKTYIGAKLRSALATPEDIETSGDLEPMFGKFEPGFEWGGMEWERSDENRASATVGVFVKGDVAADTEVFVDTFTKGDIMEKFAEFLFTKIGNGAKRYTTKGELTEWLDSMFAPHIKKIVNTIALKGQVAKAVEGEVGIFSTQKELLKKIHAGLPKPAQSDDD